jgi:serine/threonine protein phosphatase PrpC
MDQEKDLAQDIGVIHRPKKGELVSGDDYLIQRLPDKLFLIVIDGLGHGPKAHEAATTIKSVFQEQIAKGNLNLMLMFDLAHKRAASTRGGVVAAALMDAARKRISFLGVGNISIKLVGNNGNDSPISTDGIVGYTMERKKFHELPYEKGQVLIMHSDGVSERYGSSLIKENIDLSMQALAQKVVEGYGRNERDDVTFLAVKL